MMHPEEIDTDRGPCPDIDRGPYPDCSGRLTAKLTYVEPNRGYLMAYTCAQCGRREIPLWQTPRTQKATAQREA